MYVDTIAVVRYRVRVRVRFMGVCGCGWVWVGVGELIAKHVTRFGQGANCKRVETVSKRCVRVRDLNKNGILRYPRRKTVRTNEVKQRSKAHGKTETQFAHLVTTNLARNANKDAKH